MGTLLGAKMSYQAFLLLESRCVGSSLGSQHLEGGNGMSPGSARPARVPSGDPVSENKDKYNKQNPQKSQHMEISIVQISREYPHINK